MNTQQENQLLCEKLLGWERRGDEWWQASLPPTFLTGDGMLLLLETLQSAWPATRDVLRGLGGSLVLGSLTPEDVRAAALEYARTL